MPDATIIDLAARRSGTAAADVAAIQDAVRHYYGVSLEEQLSKTRRRAIAFPRMVAMYLVRNRLGLSFPEIGAHFGGRDHTTVMHAVRKIARCVEREDAAVLQALESIEQRIAARKETING